MTNTEHRAVLPTSRVHRSCRGRRGAARDKADRAVHFGHDHRSHGAPGADAGHAKCACLMVIRRVADLNWTVASHRFDGLNRISSRFHKAAVQVAQLIYRSLRSIVSARAPRFDGIDADVTQFGGLPLGEAARLHQKKVGGHSGPSANGDESVVRIVPVGQNRLGCLVGDAVQLVESSAVREFAIIFIHDRSDMQALQIFGRKVVQRVRRSLNDLLEVRFVAAEAVTLHVKNQARNCDLSVHCRGPFPLAAGSSDRVSDDEYTPMVYSVNNKMLEAIKQPSSRGEYEAARLVRAKYEEQN